jgi:hypothetical protein
MAGVYRATIICRNAKKDAGTGNASVWALMTAGGRRPHQLQSGGRLQLYNEADRCGFRSSQQKAYGSSAYRSSWPVHRLRRYDQRIALSRSLVISARSNGDRTAYLPSTVAVLTWKPADSSLGPGAVSRRLSKISTL